MRTFLALLSLCAVSSTSFADTVLYDSNGFESPTFNAGSSPVGQDPSNPWQAFGGSPGAFTVDNTFAASGSQSIRANGGGENDGSFVWPNIGYTPGANELIRIEVDMARTLSTNVADSSPVFAIDIYDDVFNRTSRFGLQQNNGEIRAFITAPSSTNPTGNAPVFVGSPIASGKFTHFDFYMNYTSKTVSLALDGVNVASGVAFRTPTSAFLDSAELQVGTFNGLSNDHGYFDNYRVSVVAVPEPASMAVMVIGFGTALIRKRIWTRHAKVVTDI